MFQILSQQLLVQYLMYYFIQNVLEIAYYRREILKFKKYNGCINIKGSTSMHIFMYTKWNKISN